MGIACEEDEIDLSVVIPVYNEDANIQLLYSRLVATLEGIPGVGCFEIIFVENGSSDGSWGTLRAVIDADTRVRAAKLTRNFGYEMAVTAGLRLSKGRSVVVMDGDLQDPPELIPTLWAKKHEGYQHVYAVRARRSESWPKQLAYKAFYSILARMSDVAIPLDAGNFAIYDRTVVDVLNAMPEKNRFVRGLRAWTGFRHAGVPYARDARHLGQTKFSLAAAIGLAADGIFSFSYTPLRMLTVLGFVFAGLSCAGIAILLGMKLASVIWGLDVVIRGLTVVNVLILLFGGLNLLALGVVGEYQWRIYDEVKQRPMYLIERTYPPTESTR